MRWLAGQSLPAVVRYPAFAIQILAAVAVTVGVAYYVITVDLMMLAGLGFGQDCSSGCTTSL
jgi:hypothetical protein